MSINENDLSNASRKPEVIIVKIQVVTAPDKGSTNLVLELFGLVCLQISLHNVSIKFKPDAQ